MYGKRERARAIHGMIYKFYDLHDISRPHSACMGAAAAQQPGFPRNCFMESDLATVNRTQYEISATEWQYKMCSSSIACSRSI